MNAERIMRLAPWLGLGLLVAAVTWVSSDYAPTYDEAVHVVSGDSAIAWYATGGRETASLTAKAFKDYGAFADVWMQLAANGALWLWDAPLYPTRHWLNAMIGVGGVVLAFRLGGLLGGPVGAWASAGLLVLTPRWLGDSFNNPKDIPFAVAWLGAVYGMARILVARGRAGWGDYVWTGLAMGAAMGIRVGGVLLLPLLGGTGLVAGLLAGEGGRVEARRVAVRVGTACLMAWGVMLVFWPSALVSPLVRPLEVLRHMSAFPFQGGMLFQGRWVGAQEVPWNYVPVWLGITLPEVLLVGVLLWLVGMALWWREMPVRWWVSWLLVVATVGPWLLAVVKGSSLYDGMRHFYFVVPLLAVLGGLGWVVLGEMCRTRWQRGAVGLSFLMGCVPVVWDIAELHPYQGVYFNRMSGGLAGAAGRYDLDYWGQSYAAGAAWLKVRPEGAGGWVAVPFMAKRLGATLDEEGEHLRRRKLVLGFLGQGWGEADPPTVEAGRWRACGPDWHPEMKAVARYRMVARRTQFDPEWEEGEPVFEVARKGVWLLRIWRREAKQAVGE